jgi:ribosomal-protein-alanine N-acetyltransferase
MKLETKRLFLREWAPADVQDIIEGLNNLNVSKWLAFVKYPYSETDAQKWIQFCASLASSGNEPNTYEFAIELKSESKVIGGISVARVNRLQGTAGGGIWINEKYQGHGYGREAFGEKIRFAFEDLKLRRLENGFFPGNEGSFKMQEKFGYKIEGTKRKAFRCVADGEIRDECITGLLKEEWIKE